MTELFAVRHKTIYKVIVFYKKIYLEEYVSLAEEIFKSCDSKQTDLHGHDGFDT